MTVIDDYLASIDSPPKAELERIHSIVKKYVPEAEEVISYGMPGFTYHGKYLIGFNTFRDHLSLFPTAHPIEVYQDKLADYKMAKGTIKFTLKHPIPETIITLLLRVRVDDIHVSNQ